MRKFYPRILCLLVMLAGILCELLKNFGDIRFIGLFLALLALAVLNVERRLTDLEHIKNKSTSKDSTT